MSSRTRYWQPDPDVDHTKSSIGERLKEMEDRAEAYHGLSFSPYTHRTKKPALPRDVGPIGTIPDMQIGDLITYNAGGMKNKIIAMVLDVVMGHQYTPSSANYTFRETINGKVTVQWLVVGKFMPRRLSSWTHNLIRPGDITDHHIGTWFEVMSP